MFFFKSELHPNYYYNTWVGSVAARWLIIIIIIIIIIITFLSFSFCSKSNILLQLGAIQNNEAIH
jgi:hypothetical protein